MIDIQLDKNYKLTSDSMNYILSRRSVKPNEKTGEYTWTGIKFASSITHILKSYKELKIRTSDSTSIDDILKISNEIDNRIDEVLNGL